MTAHNSRAQLDHHLLLCAFGGAVVGALAALLARDASTVPLPVLLLGWCVLGLLHGPLLWPLLAKRAWWTTSYVWYAGVIVVAIASAGRGGAQAIFLLPLLALWLAGIVCWRFSPRVAIPGCCRACDYDLRGLPAPRCPECGTAFGRDEAHALTTMTAPQSGCPA